MVMEMQLSLVQQITKEIPDYRQLFRDSKKISGEIPLAYFGEKERILLGTLQRVFYEPGMISTGEPHVHMADSFGSPITLINSSGSRGVKLSLIRVSIPIVRNGDSLNYEVASIPYRILAQGFPTQDVDARETALIKGNKKVHLKDLEGKTGIIVTSLRDIGNEMRTYALPFAFNDFYNLDWDQKTRERIQEVQAAEVILSGLIPDEQIRDAITRACARDLNVVHAYNEWKNSNPWEVYNEKAQREITELQERARALKQRFPFIDLKKLLI